MKKSSIGMNSCVFFVGSLLWLFSGLNLVDSEECCQTDYDTYELCSVSCCSSIYGSHGSCCSYSSYSSYSADDSKCEGWWAAHIWAGVLVGLGSLCGLIFSISLICCIVKACTASNRRIGTQGVYPGQPGQGVTMVGSSAAYPMQQQQFLQQQQFPPPPQNQQVPYGVPMQQPQNVYPQGVVGTSGYVTTTVNPTPYGDTKQSPPSGTAPITEE